MDQDGPVTVVVRHHIKPGRMAEFEEWLRGITQAMMQCDGHLGFNVVRPASTGRPEYVVFFRFDTFENLEKWERSETRRQWLEQAEPLLFQSTRERHTGLEVWFTPPAGCAQPPRWKMLPVTLLAIYPLIMGVQLTLVPFMEDWPTPLRTLLTAALLVCVMTYAAMPLMTSLFSRWLYGSTAPEKADAISR
jgi:antibiotic biosynthesis monooxygenase (ABM) superfamily enzyme